MAEYRLWNNRNCIKEFEATEAAAYQAFKTERDEAVKNLGRGSMSFVLEVKEGNEWIEAYRISVNTSDLKE